MTYVDLVGPGDVRTGSITQWRKFFITSSLVMLITFVSIGSVLFLAATLTQGRLSTVAIDGVNISIWKLDSIQDQWSSLRDKVRQRREELARAEFRRADRNGERNAALATWMRRQGQLSGMIEVISYSAAEKLPKLSEDLSKLNTTNEKFARILRDSETLSAQPDSKSLLEELRLAYAASRQDGTRYEETELRSKTLDEEIKQLREGIAESETSVGTVLQSIKKDLDDTTRARIENALYELTPADNIFGRIWKTLTVLQPDVLTLWLVVLMGVLGSSLQIAHSFFRVRRVESAGSYFLRLGVGAVTALVIFVVAKAGVPVIADASKFGGDAPINPYFISFIAIISGLLSERAIIAVQTQGERFFAASQHEPDRWARFDLTPALESQGLTTESLADYLGLRPAQAGDILTGASAATGEQQRITAIFLRRELRDIFSDIRPRQPAEPTAAPGEAGEAPGG